MLHFFVHLFLPLLLLLTTLTRSVRSLPWDPDHHPNHAGWRHPRNWVSDHLPDYPPNLPGWISDSLTCQVDNGNFWDAAKINVLYVAAHFCTYVSVPEALHLPIRCSRGSQKKHRKHLSRATCLTREWRRWLRLRQQIAPFHTYEIRPMTTLKKVYETFLFFKLNEHQADDVDVFTVLVEDMGKDCMCIREPFSSQVMVLILKFLQARLGGTQMSLLGRELTGSPRMQDRLKARADFMPMRCIHSE